MFQNLHSSSVASFVWLAYDSNYDYSYLSVAVVHYYKPQGELWETYFRIKLRGTVKGQLHNLQLLDML